MQNSSHPSNPRFKFHLNPLEALTGAPSFPNDKDFLYPPPGLDSVWVCGGLGMVPVGCSESLAVIFEMMGNENNKVTQ
jgi:hypothetical protein